MTTNVISFHAYVKRPRFFHEMLLEFLPCRNFSRRWRRSRSQDREEPARKKILPFWRIFSINSYFLFWRIFSIDSFFYSSNIKLLQFEKVFKFAMKAQEMKKSFSVKILYQRIRKISSTIK
jgi:hypothetical protein